MSEAYARGGQPKNIAGGVILILSSLLAAVHDRADADQPVHGHHDSGQPAVGY